MDANVHGSSSFLLYHLIYWLWFNTFPAPIVTFFAFICGLIPDFDGIYWTIKKKGYSSDFQHHLIFWSHWPISYLPLVAVFIISLIFDFYPQYVLLPVLGIYLHFLADSACCGDGMMWGKIPWKKNSFAPFVNWFSKKTDGYHGFYWDARWRQTKMFKIGLIMLGCSTALTIALWVNKGFSGWYLMLILGYAVLFIISSIPIPAKYREEPESGRYADYRKNPMYLEWMEREGYEFDENNFARKKKAN